jgi:hypothetical protein
VLASTRIIGLGGALTAIAEGADGIQFNPAAADFCAPSLRLVIEVDGAHHRS